MTNPVLVEVLRGDIVESMHRGAVAVFDGSGKLIFEAGDIDAPVFPRSAVKSMQALPLVESGAADAFGFGDRELALACSSHNGEPEHTELAASMLKRAGLGEAALECGVQWPNHEATVALANAGKSPSQLHNNCSGKHSGFLAACQHCGIEPKGYVAAGHPFQEMIRETMQEVTGAAHGAENRGTDGCSIPTYAIPLRAIALGFSRMASGKDMARGRARAAKRLVDACMAEPFLVAGSKRADTRLMEAAPGRIFVKGGAEGVHCGILPELGLGFALKCSDGAGRAVDVATAALIRIYLPDIDLAKDERPTLRNWRGIHVGDLRPTAIFS
jgi:L-asparaginase II